MTTAKSPLALPIQQAGCVIIIVGSTRVKCIAILCQGLNVVHDSVLCRSSSYGIYNNVYICMVHIICIFSFVLLLKVLWTTCTWPTKASNSIKRHRSPLPNLHIKSAYPPCARERKKRRSFYLKLYIIIISPIIIYVIYIIYIYYKVIDLMNGCTMLIHVDCSRHGWYYVYGGGKAMEISFQSLDSLQVRLLCSHTSRTHWGRSVC